MEYFILSIITLLLGGIFTLIINKKYALKTCTLFSFVSAVLVLIPSFKVLLSGAPLSLSFNSSAIFGAVTLEIDTLSAIFIAIISIMSFFGTVYANGYLKPYLNINRNIPTHCFFLLLLIASMLTVTVSRNCLFFLVVWEIMSLSSFFLVLFEGEKKEVRKAAVKYLVYMHLSVIFILTMFNKC